MRKLLLGKKRNLNSNVRNCSDLLLEHAYLRAVAARDALLHPETQRRAQQRTLLLTGGAALRGHKWGLAALTPPKKKQLDWETSCGSHPAAVNSIHLAC